MLKKEARLEYVSESFRDHQKIGVPAECEAKRKVVGILRGGAPNCAHAEEGGSVRDSFASISTIWGSGGPDKN